MKLKTKPLKAAYLQLLDSKNENAFKKNMQQALEEKSRFYAQRIAQTEEARSFNLANSKEILEDNEIKFVRYEMSHKHSITDICDYYANLDVGYGKGIVLKEQMITLPLHPFCYCKYEPYYRKTKFREVKNPEQFTMNQFSEYEQSKILGSKRNLEDFKRGASVISIFNRLRPNYPIKPVSDIIQGMKKNINNLTNTEREAIWEWSLDSTKIKKAMWGKTSNTKAKKEAKIIEGLFEKYESNVSPETILYRGKGISTEEWQDIYSKLKVNSVYSPDKLAISSFSKSKDIAIGFSYDSKYNKKAIIKYYSDGKNLLDISKFSSMPSEQETILDKNLWYNVKSIKKEEEGGILWLILEIEPLKK